MRIYCFIGFVLGLFMACQKQETDSPVVIITAPVENDTLYLSDSVYLQGAISDKHLAYYKLILYNYYSHKLLYKEEGAATAGSFVLNKNMLFELNEDTTVYMKVLGVDQNGNTGGAGVKFFVRK